MSQKNESNALNHCAAQELHGKAAARGSFMERTLHFPPSSLLRLMVLKRPPPTSLGIGSMVFMSNCSESKVQRQSWVQNFLVTPKACLIMSSWQSRMSPIWQLSLQSAL